MSDKDIETELAGLIYRNVLSIVDPQLARTLARQILLEFKVSR